MVRSLAIALCFGLLASCWAQKASEIGCDGCVEGRCTKVRGGRVVRCVACKAGYTLTRLDDRISRVCIKDDDDDDDGDDDDEKPGSCPLAVPGSYGCDVKCEEDDDCEGDLKCCDTACGRTCVPPEGSEGEEPAAEAAEPAAEEAAAAAATVETPEAEQAIEPTTEPAVESTEPAGEAAEPATEEDISSVVAAETPIAETAEDVPPMDETDDIDEDAALAAELDEDV